MKSRGRGDFAADRRLLLLSSMAVPIGAVCAVVALGLVTLINVFTNVFYYGAWSTVARPPTLERWGLVALAMPAVGGLIIGLMARFGSERIRGHGIPEALEAILFGKSVMSPKVAVLKPLSSAISIGSGGPFGAEGPIIMTGGAIGSIVAQAFHLTAAERKTLLVAGAAAGMAAIFASPIAAVLLAVELLLFEWRPRSLVPVALASAVAAGLRPFLLGAGPVFPVPPLPVAGLDTLAAAVLVGLAAGAFATAVSASLYKLEDQFARLPFHWMWWPALGGLAVGAGGYFEPRVLGVGYDVIGEFLQGHTAAGPALRLVALKSLVWVFALASGTSGGVLAPLLIMGSGLGAVASSVLPGAAALWPLVGMAAVMGGMMRSPFTAVIFALELTHDIAALPPLLVASIVAYAFTVLVMKRSILTEKVARRGHDVFREYGVDPLERVRLKEIMSTAVVAVPEHLTGGEIARAYFGGARKHRGYPVVSSSGALVSVVTETDLLAAEPAQHPPRRLPIVALPDESCRVAAERMAAHGIGRLIVVEPGGAANVIGIVTRSDLLKARVRAVDEEGRRERILGPKARAATAPAAP